MRSTPGYEFIFRAGYRPLIIYDRDAVICDLNRDAAGSSDTTAARPIRILLVEDNELVLEITAHTLRSLGYEVSAHTEPSRALAEFQAAPENYAMLLTDQSMPGMRGTELAAVLRSIRPDFPVLICTGYAESPVDSGAHRWLEKPLGRETLMREIAAVLRAAR